MWESGAGAPSVIIRFAAFVPLATYSSDAGSHWDLIRQNAVLQQLPFSPNIAHAEHLAAKWVSNLSVLFSLRPFTLHKVILILLPGGNCIILELRSVDTILPIPRATSIHRWGFRPDPRHYHGYRCAFPVRLQSPYLFRMSLW